jgi:hypothetical protein
MMALQGSCLPRSRSRRESVVLEPMPVRVVDPIPEPMPVPVVDPIPERPSEGVAVSSDDGVTRFMLTKVTFKTRVGGARAHASARCGSHTRGGIVSGQATAGGAGGAAGAAGVVTRVL